MNLHDENEICMIQNDWDDSFNEARVNFIGIVAWPTVVGNGVAAWVSRPGGTYISPCPYGPVGVLNEVLQSRWVATTFSTPVEELSWSRIKVLYR